jgi:hypothetical protein
MVMTRASVFASVFERLQAEDEFPHNRLRLSFAAMHAFFTTAALALPAFVAAAAAPPHYVTPPPGPPGGLGLNATPEVHAQCHWERSLSLIYSSVCLQDRLRLPIP